MKYYIPQAGSPPDPCMPGGIAVWGGGTSVGTWHHIDVLKKPHGVWVGCIPPGPQRIPSREGAARHRGTQMAMRVCGEHPITALLGLSWAEWLQRPRNTSECPKCGTNLIPGSPSYTKTHSYALPDLIRRHGSLLDTLLWGAQKPPPPINGQAQAKMNS